jgi:hypothetical protein
MKFRLTLRYALCDMRIALRAVRSFVQYLFRYALCAMPYVFFC